MEYKNNYKYKYIFFDMDGTVLNTLGDLTDATNHILTEFGYAPVDSASIAGILGNGAKCLIQQAITLSSGKIPDEETVEHITSVYKPWYNAHSRIKTAPYPGILNLMKRLKNDGVRMAVVSNKPDKTVRELSALFFGELMDVSIGESPAIKKKPAPDTVFEAIRQMGLTGSDAVPDQTLLSQCVYIGDTEVDVQTAANSGMDCIAVDWGFRSREELVAAGATVIVSSAEELYSAL